MEAEVDSIVPYKVRIADIKDNDYVNGKGFCVSLWTQGCPFRCKGCHNPETWDKFGGTEMEYADVLDSILSKLETGKEYGIEKNFSILGGEPVSLDNLFFTYHIIKDVRERYPDIKIFMWTGYNLRDFYRFRENTIRDIMYRSILEWIDVLIDGHYDEKQRDTRLELRGSKNQRILYRGKDF